MKTSQKYEPVINHWDNFSRKKIYVFVSELYWQKRNSAKNVSSVS